MAHARYYIPGSILDRLGTFLPFSAERELIRLDAVVRKIYENESFY